MATKVCYVCGGAGFVAIKHLHRDGEHPATICGGKIAEDEGLMSVEEFMGYGDNEPAGACGECRDIYYRELGAHNERYRADPDYRARYRRERGLDVGVGA